MVLMLSPRYTEAFLDFAFDVVDRVFARYSLEVPLCGSERVHSALSKTSSPSSSSTVSTTPSTVRDARGLGSDNDDDRANNSLLPAV